MNRMTGILQFIDKAIVNILKAITIIAFVLLTVILTANILARYFPVISLLWSEEIIELLFGTLVFYGAAALWIGREHFSAGDWISKFIKNDRAKQIYRLALEVMALIFAVAFFYFSLKLTTSAIAVTNVLAIPKRIFYSSMPVSGAIMVIYSIRNIVTGIVLIIKPQPKQPDQTHELGQTAM